jgi:hypothetical protein
MSDNIAPPPPEEQNVINGTNTRFIWISAKESPTLAKYKYLLSLQPFRQPIRFINHSENTENFYHDSCSSEAENESECDDDFKSKT